MTLNWISIYFDSQSKINEFNSYCICSHILTRVFIAYVCHVTTFFQFDDYDSNYKNDPIHFKKY